MDSQSACPPASTASSSSRALTSLFEPPSSDAIIRPYFDSSGEIEIIEPADSKSSQSPGFFVARWLRHCQTWKTTLLGSVIFLLYQVVFCLAQAATIAQPHHRNHPNDSSATGMMAKMAALGVLTAGPMFILQLGDQVPAIYPASDLFLAPFLAKLAETIDTILLSNTPEQQEQLQQQNSDVVFYATFSAVTGTALLLSGAFCLLAVRIKLANLGAYLPYSVLCGFFTTIGILMWMLGFSVDVGQTLGQVIQSRDLPTMGRALVHHIPSVAIGVSMHIMGRNHPLWVIALVIITVLGSYGFMWMTKTSLQRAQQLKWFFSPNDLVVPSSSSSTTSSSTFSSSYLPSYNTYGPPYPFGIWACLWRGNIHWEAYLQCIPTMIALACLYLVRSSLHSAAVKKNIPHVTRKRQAQELSSSQESSTTSTIIQTSKNNTTDLPPKTNAPLTLSKILEQGYGYSQLVAALVGGIAVAPSVAASQTLFQLGAETVPPQYGSCILLAIFYLTDFTLVQYIPKPAFSCLMVLAGLDMCRTWMIGSYLKTKTKSEWIVAPLLVALAFWMGLLNAIFCGIACSTFIFVANFYHAVRTWTIYNSHMQTHTQTWRSRYQIVTDEYCIVPYLFPFFVCDFYRALSNLWGMV